jgi:hypothetical protein
MSVTFDDVQRNLAAGAASAAGFKIYNKAEKVAEKVNKYNIEHNPIEKGRDDRPSRRAEETPKSPIEMALVGGGIVAAVAGAPIVGVAAVAAGSVLTVNRVESNRPENESICKTM